MIQRDPGDGTCAGCDEPASPTTQGLTHVEALLLAVLRDWPGAHSVSTLADRKRLIGVQVSAIRLTADRLASRGLVARAGFGSEYRITDAGHDALTAHERDQST